MQHDAALRVAGDEVSRNGCGSADGVRIGVGDFDPAETVPQGCHARSIGADQIAFDEVAVGIEAAIAIQPDAELAVAGDDVPRADYGAADDVSRPPGDLDSFIGIGQRGSPGGVRANIVSLDLIVVAAGDENAVGGIARNDVPVGGRGSADGVARSTAIDLHTLTVIAQRGRPCRIRAEIVAGNQIARGPGAGNLDAGTAIAGYHVSCAGGGSANGVVRSTRDQDAIEAIGSRGGSRGVQADVVPLDNIVRRASFQSHASVGIAGNDVAVGGGRSADEGIGCIREHDSRAVGPHCAIGC